MAGKNTAIFGIYSTHEKIASVILALQSAGFRIEDISVLYSANEGSKDFAHEKATKAPEGASAGAGTGAVIGGALGVLMGVGMLAIPGFGPFMAAGPLVAGLAGVGAGGAIGGIAGALIGLGIPEYEAKRYEGRVRQGGILVSVHSDSAKWTKKAKEILERTGALDISSTGEAAADYATTDKPLARSVTGDPSSPITHEPASSTDLGDAEFTSSRKGGRS
ncbi:MAG TPA: DUF3341 domain-containing protein [Terriglobia bacterium]|nr:DUF3341 domain-containing protein [Terriglobia bacterium]